MKKIAALTAMLLVMAMLLVACGSPASSSVSQLEESSSAPSSAPESSSLADSSLPDSSESMADSSIPTGTQSSGALSADWQSQQVEVNGVVYTFPVASVQEFLDNGWACDDSLDFTLPANTRTTGFTFKTSDDQRITLSFINTSGETKDAMDCQIETLSFSLHAYTKGAVVILPGGIQHESSYDDVIAAWGEPSEEKDGGSYLKLTYGVAYNHYILDFDYENKTINGISISFDTPV